VTGPVASAIEGGFYENFTEAAPEAVPVLDLSSSQSAADSRRPEDSEGGGDYGRVTTEVIDGAAFAIRSSPSGGANDLKRLYLLALAAARQTVDITTPYFIPDESSLWSLEDAVGRGVRIRLLVEGDQTDALPVKRASRRYYDRLLALGIEIYEYQPTMMHAKTFVVDGIWSMVGSANFDNRSLELNDELNVAVTSRTLAARLLADFEQDLQSSRRLALSEWRARPLVDKVREQFWALFGEIF
jgi:cardiolipin synthase